MRLHVCLLKENDCYKAGRRLTPRGVMVHSTGANNPNVSRYVPGDEVTGRNTGGNHWDQPGVSKCVHAFVGKFADGGVGTVQTLPWDMRGWHCASGPKGSGNNTHIGFELCEDGLEDGEYFEAVYREAVELTAMLCREYGLNPMADGVVICHQEGYQRGVASNHADVLHWFPRFGKSMDDFRADVAREMEGGASVTQEQFDKMMEDYLARRAKQPVSGWARELLARAMERGITDGGSPQAFATRQEVAAMVNAAVEREKK